MKKKKFPPRFCSYNNEFAEFSANEIRGGKKGREGGGVFDERDSVGGGASHRATCECEHKSKLAAT